MEERETDERRRRIALMVALLAVAPATSAGGLRAAIAGPSVTETIIVGTSPGYDHYDPGNGNVYVSDLGSANVSVISGTTLHVFATVAVGSSPKGMDYDPLTHHLGRQLGRAPRSGSCNDSQNAVVGAVTGLTAPTRPEWSSVNTTMWVTENATAGRVAVVNGSSYAVVKTLRAGTATVGITHDPARDAMLVSNYGSSNVTVFDALTYAKLATVAINAHPEALACFDNDTIGECFVASESTGKLAVINDTLWRVEANLTVGSGPIGVQVDHRDRPGVRHERPLGQRHRARRRGEHGDRRGLGRRRDAAPRNHRLRPGAGAPVLR